MERDHIPVAALGPVVVDEPVLDGPGRIGEEGPPVLLIAQDRLVKGQHGDAQLVLVAVLRGGMDEFYRLAADEPHVLPDQGVRRLRVRLRRVHLSHDAVFRAYHTLSLHPPPAEEYGATAGYSG